MDRHFKIIVPFYNVEQWIKLTLRSIKLQDYKNFECIIVDDMSTDDSLDIVKKEVSGDKRFKIVKNTVKKYVLKNLCDAIELSKPKS